LHRSFGPKSAGSGRQGSWDPHYVPIRDDFHRYYLDSPFLRFDLYV
jgi:hypothetical protein